MHHSFTALGMQLLHMLLEAEQGLALGQFIAIGGDATAFQLSDVLIAISDERTDKTVIREGDGFQLFD